MRMNLLSTVAMSAIAAAVAWGGQVAADDFHGDGPDFGQHNNNGNNNGHHGSPQNEARTATPIKHLVVIFNENRSLDHYFATYPHATNPPGQPIFKAARNTPKLNNLAANPYSAQQQRQLHQQGQRHRRRQSVPPRSLAGEHAVSGPLLYARAESLRQRQGRPVPEVTGKGTAGGAGAFGTKGQVMGYFDGNTVTAMWNYAQNFAMSDNAYTDTYGPSTPGAINVISGQTNGVKKSSAPPPSVITTARAASR